MSNPVIRMPIDAVARHAGSVDTAADAITTAKAAAAQVQMGGEAYGKICVLLPGLIGMLSGSGVEALDAAATSLRETANHLRPAAGSAKQTDRASATRRSAIKPKIDLPL